MARPREFDRDQVVDLAVDVFWRKGFEATSIQDLVEATGLNRGSLYNTFGDKAGLFEAVFGRYMASAPTQPVVAAAETGPPRQVIEEFFARLVELGAADPELRGCLMTNTAAGMATRDEDVAARVAAAFHDLEDALFRLIERGQETGEIAPWRDSRALARFLVASAQGLRIMARVNRDRAALEAIADIALSNLD
ncbi:MAG: TetR/AcrR family transcriptional regulator [Rhodospirillales bacterium]